MLAPLLKNVDEKMLENFRKMLTRKMLATLPKNVDEKNVRSISEKC
jgi:hypothetical protein